MIFLIIGAVVIVFIVLAIILNNEKCPKCGKRKTKKTEFNMLSKRYMYVNKDGRRDNRYKVNPEIGTFQYKYECKVCLHTFEKIVDEQITSKHTKLFENSYNELQKKSKELQADIDKMSPEELAKLHKIMDKWGLKE